ncbi:hypothetical protein GJAV_G00155690 [Gymnothorax javanicus]|nr:hypothetical protein GJAV_G00155690 [Gymnothorax javanicus]
MKQADSGRSFLQDLDQSWPSFLNPMSRLRLNTLDFSDLWDEDDVGLDGTEENGEWSNKDGFPKPVPPPPPALPLLAPPRSQTLRLHWKALELLPLLPRVAHFGPKTIWAELEPVKLDTRNLQQLFHRKPNNNLSMERASRSRGCITVLTVKRSNIITITLSSLPPPRLLPAAILSMDCSVLEREDLQKLQTLAPSEEELQLIQEAQARSPGSPLAPAELCLTTLGTIPHLGSRLQLWAFALDYDSLERDIAEPLFYLKQAMEQLAASQTFHRILATVLAIGNFLNGCKARGFELSYLGKLSQVRDTQSRQPLLQHVCAVVLQLYPQSSDLFSELPAVTRASKWEYSQVGSNLAQLQSRCKESWEQLCLLGQAEEQMEDQADSLRKRLPDFLRESEERLSVLHAVYRRVINRFHSFLLYLGYSRETVREMKAEVFCKSISDFALEYKTMRQAILQRREREERGTSSTRTPTPNNTAIQDITEESMLEEILRTPDSTLNFQPTPPRHRSKRSGVLSRGLKW